MEPPIPDRQFSVTQTRETEKAAVFPHYKVFSGAIDGRLTAATYIVAKRWSKALEL